MSTFCSSHQEIFKSNIEVVTQLDRLSQDVSDMKGLLERLVERVTLLETELAVWKRISERRMVLFGSFIGLLAATAQLVPVLTHG